MSSRRRILRISNAMLPALFTEGLHAYEVIKDALPQDAAVANCCMSPDFREVVFLITSDSFAVVPEGQPYPEITPILRSAPSETPA